VFGDREILERKQEEAGENYYNKEDLHNLCASPNIHTIKVTERRRMTGQ
jgi:hypothetical protein